MKLLLFGCAIVTAPVWMPVAILLAPLTKPRHRKGRFPLVDQRHPTLR